MQQSEQLGHDGKETSGNLRKCVSEKLHYGTVSAATRMFSVIPRTATKRLFYTKITAFPRIYEMSNLHACMQAGSL